MNFDEFSETVHCFTNELTRRQPRVLNGSTTNCRLANAFWGLSPGTSTGASLRSVRDIKLIFHLRKVSSTLCNVRGSSPSPDRLTCTREEPRQRTSSIAGLYNFCVCDIKEICLCFQFWISLSAFMLAFDFYGCSSCQTTSWFGLDRWNSWLQLATWHRQLDITRQESHSRDSPCPSTFCCLPF